MAPLVLYAVSEIAIGTGGFMVPELFQFGRDWLMPVGSMDSGRYLFFSGAIIFLSLLPWCFFMGATIPCMIAFLKNILPGYRRSFSFLYLANVMGASAGVLAAGFVMIELLGFRDCLKTAAYLNFSLAVFSWFLLKPYARIPQEASAPTLENLTEGVQSLEVEAPPVSSLLILFLTGFISMAMEIVWVRAFTPALGTVVYAFSGLLAVYLVSTWAGSWLYRKPLRSPWAGKTSLLIGLISASLLFPLLASDPGTIAKPLGLVENVYQLTGAVPILLLSIVPFSMFLGYLTPMLIDRYAGGDPARTGQAYGVNIIGSIIGPLVAGFGLLPWLGARFSMILLVLPFLGLSLADFARGGKLLFSVRKAVACAVVCAGLLYSGLFGTSYEEGPYFSKREIRRDYAATVISHTMSGSKQLVVNGQPMTKLSPVLKAMVHFLLALLNHKPESGLVIALGMGTTYRSLISWDIDSTVVELSPSVMASLEYYYDDAGSIRNYPRGHMIVDDGRRFLARTKKSFDLIAIDPPPPIYASGSSLLYSLEFYELIKKRLKSGGILAQWYPGGSLMLQNAFLHTILKSFPYVRVFRSMENWGLHILCSMKPIDVPSAETLSSRIPSSAREDLMASLAPLGIVQVIRAGFLNQEIDYRKLFFPDKKIWITDDRPYNEYFLLRHWFKE